MVFEAEHFGIAKITGLYYARHDPALFFLRRKAAHHAIKPARIKPSFSFGITPDRIRLFNICFWPFRAESVEVRGVKQWHGVRPRHVAQVLLQAEIDDRASRYLDTNIVQRVTNRGG